MFKKNQWLLKKKTELSNAVRNSAQYNNDKEYFDVQRLDNLTEKEFKKFVKAGVPVIFNQEAADWACTKNWSFDFVVEKYGDYDVDVVNRDGLIDEDTEIVQDNGKTMKLRDIVSDIKQNKDTYYLRFCRLMETFSELQLDMNLNWLAKMRQCFWGYSYQTFIGGKDKFTPWHCGATAFFFIMVDGTKDWNLYPPNLYSMLDPPNNGYGYFFSNVDTDGNNKYIKPYKCTLEKGDILFIPAWMWHKVENKTDSWGISYRFVNIWGIITQPVFSTIRLFFTNPSFFAVMKNSLTSKPEKAFNLSPKLFGK